MLGPVWNPSNQQLLGQISPGPLAQPHAELNGTLQCTKCHGGGKEAMNANCLGCHKDIAWLNRQQQGYHSGAEVRGQTCASCHPDHAGADFHLIKWPDGSRDRFDHRRAGWPLLQSHARQGCGDCHTRKFQVSPAAKLAPGQTQFVGLDRSCVSCHEDIHRGGLGNDCTKCHDAGKWSATPGFDHDRTRYPLTNKHITVGCEKCHLTRTVAGSADSLGRPVPVFRPVAHQSCADCHKDPHAGRLGPGCAQCHSTAGFGVLDQQRFAHDRTRYPLTGRHVTVRCSACHKDFSTAELKRPSFQTCGACHRDAHGGSASIAGQPADCAECHTVQGFTPGSFTVARHQRTRYPLEGKHQASACAGCHRRESDPARASRLGTSKVIMRPAFQNCTDCHRDQHGGQLASRVDQGECAACHRLSGWSPSAYDSTAHAKTRFALDGRHEEIGCRDCHGTSRKGLPAFAASVTAGKGNFVFHLAETTCSSCHTDPHRGALKADNGCATCHSSRSFRPATIDVALHDRFSFPLAGAHRATPCVACHKEMKAPPSRQSTLIAAGGAFHQTLYRAPSRCSDCHQTPHGDQFTARSDAGRCDACHDAVAFAPASKFNHDRDASFALKGAHEKVPCNRCHQTAPGGDPHRLIYRPVSGKCENCHAGKEAR